VVVGVQVPFELAMAQDSHCPVHASLQQTPSAQWLVAHSASPLQAEPAALATQTPLLQTGVLPLQPPQQVAIGTQSPLQSFMAPAHIPLPAAPPADLPPVAMPPVPVAPPLAEPPLGPCRPPFEVPPDADGVPSPPVPATGPPPTPPEPPEPPGPTEPPEPTDPTEPASELPPWPPELPVTTPLPPDEPVPAVPPRPAMPSALPASASTSTPPSMG